MRFAVLWGGTYFILKSLEDSKPQYMLLAGLLGALSFWFKQPWAVVNLFWASGLLVFYFNHQFPRPLRSFLFFFLGFWICNFLFFYYLHANEAVVDWYKQSILMARDFTKTESPFIKAMWVNQSSDLPLYFTFPYRFLPVCLFLSLVIAASRYFRFSNKSDGAALLLSLVGVGTYLQYYPAPSSHHVAWATSPFYGLLAYSAMALTGGLEERRRRIILLSFCLLFTLSLSHYFNLPVKRFGKLFYDQRRSVPGISILDGLAFSRMDQYQDLTRLGRAFRAFKWAYPKRPFVDFEEPVFAAEFTEFGSAQESLTLFSLSFLGSYYPDQYKRLSEFIGSRRPLIYARRAIWDHFKRSDQGYVSPQGIVLKGYVEMTKYRFDSVGEGILVVPMEMEKLITSSLEEPLP